jgi:F-type H+-transporting ATPase subunit delta
LQTSKAARRYAAALYSLAKDEGRTREIRTELEGLSHLLETETQLRDVLLTPLHPAKDRKKVLAALAGRAEVCRTVQNFYAYLIDRRRLIGFAGIRDEYIRLDDEASGLVKASITVASELDDRRKDRLRRALSEQTGCEVQLDLVVDPTLVGGAIAKVGDLVFDGSIRTQLGQLRANLTKGS